MERRYWSNEEKLKIVKEVLETGNCSVVADKRQIAKGLVARWVRAYKEQTNPDLALGAPSRQQRRQLPYNPDAYKKSLTENDRLKKLLGEKDLEIEILRDLLKKTNPQWPKK